MAASNSGLEPIIKLLIGKGADVNRVDKENQTALLFAASNHNTKICEFLLEEAKADVDI